MNGPALLLLSTVLAPVAALAADDNKNRIEHDLLRGTWSLTSIQDNGDRLGPTVIRDKLAENGRVTIGERLIKVISPVTGETRMFAFRLGVDSSPKTIELTNQNDDLIRGIYRFNGDNLEICVRHDRDGSAPSDFSAPEGSRNLMLTLHIVSSEQLTEELQRRENKEAQDLEQKRAAAHQVRQASDVRPAPAPEAPTQAAAAPTAPTPPTQPAPGPTADDLARARDLQIRRMLIGSWTQTDPQGSVTTVFYNDGTYSATRRWAASSNQFFSGTTTSSGTWSYSQGQVTMKVSRSTDPQLAGQVLVNRLHSIGDRSATYIDVLGRIQHTTRLQ